MRNRICRRMRHLASAFLQNELNSRDQHRMEEHLATCERCREEIRLMQLSLSSLRYLETVPVPLNFRTRVHQRIAEEAQWKVQNPFKPCLKRLAWAALGVLLLSLGISKWWHAHQNPRQVPAYSPNLVVQAGKQITTFKADSLSSSKVAQASTVHSSTSTAGKKIQKASVPLNPRSKRAAKFQNTEAMVAFRNVTPPRSPSSAPLAAVPELIVPLDSMLQYTAQGGEKDQALALPGKDTSAERPRGAPQDANPSEQATLESKVPAIIGSETEGEEGTRTEGGENSENFPQP